MVLHLLWVDRWTVIFYCDKEPDDPAAILDSDCQIADTNEENTQMYVMNNYMGVGIDAELSLSFHNARQKNPDKFNSRFVPIQSCIFLRFLQFMRPCIVYCRSVFYISTCGLFHVSSNSIFLELR